MQSVLKNVPNDRLRAYTVWCPMFPSDSRSWAQTRSNEFSDPRLSYYWDGGKATGEDWGKALGIDPTAWDVYFLFERTLSGTREHRPLGSGCISWMVYQKRRS